MEKSQFLPLTRFLLLLLTALVFSASWLQAEIGIQDSTLPRGTRLAGQGVTVENLAWKIGRATLRIKRGVATPIQNGDRVVGHFFKGEGELDYISLFEPEFSVIDFNIKQHKGPKVEESGVSRCITIPVEDIAVFHFGVTEPALSYNSTPGTADAYLRHREYFDKFGSNPLGNLMALRTCSQSAAPLVWIECRQQTMAYTYELDGVQSKRETLYAMHPDASWGPLIWGNWMISQQPIRGETSLYQPTPLVLTNLDLDLEATSKTHAKIIAEETLQVQGPSRLLVLSMVNKILNRGNIKALEENPIRVIAVRGPDGNPLPYSHHDGELAVLMPALLKTGESTKLTFEIEGDLLQQHEGDEYWELSIFPWFPWPAADGLNFTLHAKVKLPKPYVPIMSGETVRREEEGAFNVLETRLDKPVGWIAVSGGKYTLKEYSRDGITVRLAGYAGLGVSSERLAKTALGIISYYQALLGPFPCKELNIVERKEWGQGQAPAGMVWISQEAFDPISDLTKRVMASLWINQGLAHEIAHQYWGIRVKMASNEDQWLTEAFAEYCSGLVMLSMKGKEADKFESIVEHWRERAKIAHKVSPIPLVNRISPSDHDRQAQRFRQDILYFQGACLLHALHQDLGDAAFKKWLWLLQSNLGFKQPMTTEMLVPFLNYVSKREYGPYLERYYWHTELPPFSQEILPKK